MLKEIRFDHRTLQLPIIQGGMGVGVSLSSLAGHVMKEGAMGVISADVYKRQLLRRRQT